MKMRKVSSTPSTNNCFSMYVPTGMWWKIQLADRLARKTKRASVSSLFIDLLDIALIDNELMDIKGRSMVTGIGPKSRKQKIVKTSLKGVKKHE